MQKLRPRNLNLLSIRLPLPALVSILHRVSGLLLFVAIPGILLGLQLSLRSEQYFGDLVQLLRHPFPKLLMVGLLWAFIHHFFAGLRHLALDMHWGVHLSQARMTGWLVLAVGFVSTVAVTIRLW